ncbi:hypothetical protein D3C80_1105960 [compost metagenome]
MVQVYPFGILHLLPEFSCLHQSRLLRAPAQFFAEPEIVVQLGQVLPVTFLIKVHPARVRATSVLEAGGRQQVQRPGKARDDIEDFLHVVGHINPRQHAHGVRLP